ncbi:Membrane protein of unknown function [Desulfonispora thiosulfatigenes DSM 11270]|uniref:Lysine exporter LysO n=1 Tax=Desulfonispora thiosulfatigenes DSM 11270 TaxID=656914 RepID=A0A1W1UZ40_DESTI|nr:LysO family transporter [Desulfonispora thiosulfatigenes]SMB86373.1 Membrane protein of unknown function [Desulfonispora thiosulfatigenes DSM 11270]
MWSILGALILGMLVGWFKLFSYISKESIDKIIVTGLILMLFAMGLGIGSNPDIVNNLSTLGVKAFFISFASIAGSVFVLWILQGKILEGEKK